MHRALQIPDVVHNVVEHLDLKTLPKLARVSKVFWGPCVAVLWRDMTEHVLVGIHAFKSVLPHTLVIAFDGGNRDDNDPLHGFPVIPSESDWERFRLYASFVQKVSFQVALDIGSFFPADLFFLNTLAIYRPSMPLFPSLRDLNVSVGSNGPLSLCLQVLTPTLDSFSIYGKANVTPRCMMSFLDRVREQCPNIRYIGAGDDCFNDTWLQSELVSMFAALPRLTEVMMACDIGEQFLGQLSRYSNLQKVSIASRRTPTSSSTYLFNIHSMYLAVPPWVGANLMGQLKLPHLEELSAEFFAPYRPGSLYKLNTYISRACPNLRKLEFVVSANVMTDDQTHTTVEDFLPLFRCYRLRHLSIEFECHWRHTVIWSDAEIEHIVQLLPKIEYLELGQAFPVEDHPCISLLGLSQLAHGCRALHTLKTTVDMTSFQPPHQLCAPSPSLKTLALHEFSVVVEDSRIYGFLSHIWPNARASSLYEDSDKDDIKAFCSAFNAWSAEPSPRSISED